MKPAVKAMAEADDVRGDGGSAMIVPADDYGYRDRHASAIVDMSMIDLAGSAPRRSLP